MVPLERPLSPHLTVYRWQIGNTLSILHRLTGATLSLGGVALVAWLVALAAGPDAYRATVGWLGAPAGIALLVVVSFGFFYHLCNGIRHLFWDAGRGFDLSVAWASGVAVVCGAVGFTIVFWLVALAGTGS